MTTPLIEMESADSNTITVFSPAKVNLWLEVLGRRDDGFHEIVSLMVPTGLKDRLSLKFETKSDHLSVPEGGAPTGHKNLVLQALDLARKTRPIPPLRIELSKKIPAEAGLGGGSSNAAAMLTCLHQRYPDPRGLQGVFKDAASLGSDIAFFLGTGPGVVRGRGEILEPVEKPLFEGISAHVCIWYPGFGLSTAAVYQQLSGPLTSSPSCRNFNIKNFQQSSEGFQFLFNRLFDGARQLDSRITLIADMLEAQFPGRWIMTGSGSGFVIVAENLEASESDAALLKGEIDSGVLDVDSSSESRIQDKGIFVVPLQTQP